MASVAACMAERAASPAGPVITHAVPPAGKGIASFPRIDAGPAVPAPIAAKINASLQRLDHAAAAAAEDCNNEFKESQGRPMTDGWERKVSVTMKGPGFYSVEASDFQFCGGAHPDEDTLPMVYDLTTGKPLDWLSVLPAEASGDTDTTLAGTTVGLVTWDALNKLALQAATKDCRDVLKDQEKMRFLLSLDARSGAVVVRLFGLPHVVAACEEPFRIPAPQAKRLGFASRVTDALVAATALQH